MTKIYRLFAIVMTTLFIFGGSMNNKAVADEGMWLPFLIDRLNYQDLQKMGLKLTPEEIYSVNNSSLKDAIVQFGNGCTGEIISSQGLILTNHHCGYGNIQEHSTVEHDYLKDGFWAMKKEDELLNPGLSVSFLIRIDDVTKDVLKDVKKDMNEQKRAETIAKKIKELIAAAKKDNHYDVSIKPFFNGNEYYMFVMEKYEDVRLVGAPPSSIGKYGGDTDNWMWPRHTGDFSMFRVYTSPDGKPAKYSKDNIPMKPKHHLPVSLKGVQKDDYAMILGYPGSTERYITSFAIENKLNHEFPTRIKIRRKKLDIMKEGMNADPKVRIQYASKYARTANYWKNFIGMSKALKKLNVVEDKKALEKEMTAWINQFASRKESYGKIFADIENAYKEIDNYTLSRYYFIEGIYLGPEALRFSMQFQGLAKMLSEENPDQEAINAEVERLRKEATKFYKDFNLDTEKKIFINMMQMYFDEVPASQMTPELLKLKKSYCCKWEKLAEKSYKKSIFSSLEEVNAFLDNPSKKVMKDPMMIMMNQFFTNYHTNEAAYAKAKTKLGKANRLFVDALRNMKKDDFLYPDANFTMRLTYGKVLDYYPQDAVHFDFYTTMEGIMEKEDPNNDEFIVPDRLKEIYETKDYGQYADPDGTMKVCFLSDNDITGGNSGSPVINGNGELIGLAFDGNWEAMSGDILFDPALQRTINVDIRYVLMIIDKYAGATNLIEEMTLIK